MVEIPGERLENNFRESSLRLSYYLYIGTWSWFINSHTFRISDTNNAYANISCYSLQIAVMIFSKTGSQLWKPQKYDDRCKKAIHSIAIIFAYFSVCLLNLRFLHISAMFIHVRKIGILCIVSIYYLEKLLLICLFCR